MEALEGGAVSHEQGTPVGPYKAIWDESTLSFDPKQPRFPLLRSTFSLSRHTWGNVVRVMSEGTDRLS